MDEETSVIDDEKTVEDSIRDAIKEVNGAKEDTSAPEDKAVSVEETVDDKKTDQEVTEIKLPDAYNKHDALKTKWSELPIEVKQAILAREEEANKGFTKLDEDRNFGKSLKEVIAPYMPIIQSEGGTPATAVQSLLNSAYILRHGDPITKAKMVSDLIDQYKIDLSVIRQQDGTQRSIDPVTAALYQKVQQLEAQLGQNTYQNNSLQSNIISDKIESEYRAFSENPANIYKDIVKDDMAMLLEKDLAGSYQEAYDKAIGINQQARSATIEREAEKRLADIESKRKAEVESKRKASVSIHGSPGLSQANSMLAAQSNNNTVEDDIRAAMREVFSS